MFLNPVIQSSIEPFGKVFSQIKLPLVYALCFTEEGESLGVYPSWVFV